MPKFIKIFLYIIGGYALILGLLSLITSNSKCNILSSGSCGAMDAIYMVMLIPAVIPMTFYKESQEKERIKKLQIQRREGVLNGDRESLEACVNDGCFLGSPIDDPNPKETQKIKKIASQKLILFDRMGNPPLEDIKQAYMMMAYWNLSEDEKTTSNKYASYISRAWQLLVEYNQKNDYKLSYFDYLITNVGGKAYLLKYQLLDKTYSDIEVKNIFDGCMLDSFWKQAKYSSDDADVEILHSCYDAIDEYTYRKKLKQDFAKLYKNKWGAQWETQLKNRH